MFLNIFLSIILLLVIFYNVFSYKRHRVGDIVVQTNEDGSKIITLEVGDVDLDTKKKVSFRVRKINMAYNETTEKDNHV